MAKSWQKKEYYFQNIDRRFNALWSGQDMAVWQGLLVIKKWQQDFLKTVNANQEPLAGLQFQTKEHPAYWVGRNTKLTEDWVDRKHNIFLGQGCFLETGATIYANSVLLENCEVRQGAYLRGNLIAGPNCVLGHATEVKNSILLGGVEAGHFAYIGDSMVGCWVNVGAGTKLSNLPFREFEAKQQQTFDTLKFMVEGEKIQHPFTKFGSILGDGCETGCNTTLSPLVLLGMHCWVWPNLHVPPGVYVSDLKLRTTEGCWQQRLQN